MSRAPRHTASLASQLAIAIAFAAIVTGAAACTREAPSPITFGELLDGVGARPQSERDAYVHAFVERRGPTPLRDGSDLIFVVEGEPQHPPRIVGDINGWGSRGDDFDPAVGAMSRIAETRWFYLRAPAAEGARLEYLIARGPDDFDLDPWNPHRVQSVGRVVSEVTTPGYEQPRELRNETAIARRGDLHPLALTTTGAGARRAAVYTPPDYDPRSGPYPVVYFHDGSLLIETGRVPQIIDALIAERRVRPLAAVFIDPASRVDDYGVGAEFREFVLTDVVPAVERSYAVSHDAALRAAIGVSRSAIAAIDLAWFAPQQFGLCGVLIPSVHPTSLIETIAGKPPAQPLDANRRALRFAIVTGRYDVRWLGEGRALRDAVASRGLDLWYEEAQEGHSPQTWRNHMGQVLERFFPPS